MANLASKSRTSADAARAEAAALRALEQRRGRAQIAPAPRAARFTAAIVKPLLKDTGASLSDLRRAWPEIVGERLAGLTFPEKLQRGEAGGVLTVVAHASAAPFVQHQQRLIVERANLAGAAIGKLLIRQGAAPKPAANVRRIVRPLTEAEEAALAAALDAVASSPLKAALMRLGRAVSAG